MDFNIVSIVAFLGMFFLLMILGFVLYKKILTKAGIIAVDPVFVVARIISTNFGSNIKNGFLRFLVNLIGDLFVTLVFVIYCFTIFIVLLSIVSKLS